MNHNTTAATALHWIECLHLPSRSIESTQDYPTLLDSTLFDNHHIPVSPCLSTVGFMLQTGDPLGNGTGGQSIWDSEFEDEFVKSLK